jgi:hypothetical protein
MNWISDYESELETSFKRQYMQTAMWFYHKFSQVNDDSSMEANRKSRPFKDDEQSNTLDGNSVLTVMT